MKQEHTDIKTISVRLLANLKKYSPENDMMAIHKDETIIDVIGNLGINPELVQMAFVDGRFVELDSMVGDAQKVLLLPAIGGG